MMHQPDSFAQEKSRLLAAPKRWLVTGAAGFIGSHLVESLLELDQTVVGLDNFSTGRQQNLDNVRGRVGDERWGRFRLIIGDTRTLADCHAACEGIELVLHQAALGSVPRSLGDPINSHASNVDGFLNMLVAARDAGVRRFVFASSSSVYGDHPTLPKVEHTIGEPLSPYAATKFINEVYGKVFHRNYRLSTVGLRYFNVFGPRQDPEGAYAAVIPRWFLAAARDQEIFINGDGETSRDFCYVANVVQANLLAATTTHEEVSGQVFNIAAGRRTTLNELFGKIATLAHRSGDRPALTPQYRPEREGDVRHSLADITRAQTVLGYQATHDIDQGLDETAAWFLS